MIKLLPPLFLHYCPITTTGHSKYAVLLFLSLGQVYLLYCVWESAESGRAAHERQVLELCLLQVHLCLWSDERSRDAGDVVLVCLVCCAWYTTAHRTTV